MLQVQRYSVTYIYYQLKTRFPQEQQLSDIRRGAYGGRIQDQLFCTDSDCYSSVKPVLGYAKWDTGSYSWKTTSTKEMLVRSKVKADVPCSTAAAPMAVPMAEPMAAAEPMALDQDAAWAATGGNAL
jgi:hypothetical protein